VGIVSRRAGNLFDELLAADDPDLGETETLGAGEHERDLAVLGVLVRAQVDLGLRRLGAAAAIFSSSAARSSTTSPFQ
jgi:hypothetical protein